MNAFTSPSNSVLVKLGGHLYNGCGSYMSAFGEVAEWTKALAWRASRQVLNLSRGFKSHPLRQICL